MRNGISNGMLLLIALVCTTCLDEIELKNQRFDTKAVIIQGKIVNGSTAVAEVTVQRIGDYDGIELETHVSAAKVTLVSESGASIDLSEISAKRLYRVVIPGNHPTFRVQNGQGYSIRVTLPDGRKYESGVEKMIPVPKLEKTSFQQLDLALPNKKGFISTAAYLRFWVNTSLKAVNSSEKVKLRWELTGVYRLTDDRARICYYTEPVRLEKIFIYDGAAFQQERLDKHPLADALLDYRFAEGFYLTLIQESLSYNAFQYWDQVRNLAERSGNMFEAPAATIASNIKNSVDPKEPVFGFFYATTQDTMRLYVRPEQVGGPVKYCPQPPTPRIGPTICDNCLLQTGSTLTKPSFWID